MDAHTTQRAKHRELQAAQKKTRKEKVERIQKVHDRNRERGQDFDTNLTGHAEG